METTEPAAYRPAVRKLKPRSLVARLVKKIRNSVPGAGRIVIKFTRKNKNTGSDGGLWKDLSPRCTAFADNSPYHGKNLIETRRLGLVSKSLILRVH